MEVFDHLEWTYDGVFEQLFDPGRGDLKKTFQKIRKSTEGGGGVL